MHSALIALGFDHSVFSDHSFRSGAAMAAAQAGLPHSTIQTLSQWNSTVFMSYIHTPHHQLATLTGTLRELSCFALVFVSLLIVNTLMPRVLNCI